MPQPYRQMIDNEIKINKEKGLCIQCDEKFNLGHHWKRRELNIIVVQEGEDLSEESDKVVEKTEDKGDEGINT